MDDQMSALGLSLDDIEIVTDREGIASTAKLTHLRKIECCIQAKWEREKLYETQSMIDEETGEPKPKFMVTFPYPYMNGRLHLGHAFSMTKAEFAVRYHRLCGKNAIFPFAFHCTGTPIQAAAGKIKKEMELYGFPPVFPKEEENNNNVEKESIESKMASKSKGKKTKAVQKGGGTKMKQWEIMEQMNIGDADTIRDFAEPEKWLEYFPKKGMQDLKLFGVGVDWRRSFITTPANPFYDAFIRWQFNKLKEGDRIKFGKRANVFSTSLGEVCLDHDRDSGEGVNPQEYVLIKLKVLELSEALAPLQGKDVFMVPATLRPETMYGQTNCFVLPEGDYGAFEMPNGEIFIMSERSAIGLAHQEYEGKPFMKEWGKVNCILKCKGHDLLGLPLKAPNAVYERVYTLPLLTISMGKGTGVVTSVPSDAPDDYATLKELKEKPLFREKFGITDEMVMPFDVIPIIDVPGFGDMAAQVVCEKYKIQSPNDPKLALCKEEVYMKGFYEGIMKVGKYAGMKVEKAKPIIKQDLIDSGDALLYFEPESKVVSRDGDECCVAHTEQWYLAYSDEEWTKTVMEHISNIETFNANDHGTGDHLRKIQAKVEWLQEWACVRQFGLGTKLPWDEKWIIESLSDSTIYMAYYTIAHILQGEDNLDGLKGSPNGIKPSDLTDQVFDFIFKKGPVPSDSSITIELLEQMKKEFEYWYPMDLRVSAKDLIGNHLTMALFNHVEVWKDSPEMWPKGYYCNGHIMVNNQKMSKSKGNFLMVTDVVDKYSVDGSRLALADAGDSLEDANFVDHIADSFILNLIIEEENIVEFKSGSLTMRTADEPMLFMDKVFDNDMNEAVTAAKKAFDDMLFKDALKQAWYIIRGARDSYREWSKLANIPMRSDLLEKFFNSMLIMITPFAPHFSEYMWLMLGPERKSITYGPWPVVPETDYTLLKCAIFVREFIKRTRGTIAKRKNNENKAWVFVSEKYSENYQKVLLFMQNLYAENNNTLPADLLKKLKGFVVADAALKPAMKNIMQFASFVAKEVSEVGADAMNLESPFSELEIFEDNKNYLLLSLGVDEISFHNISDPDAPGSAQRRANAQPGKPSVELYN